MLEIKKKQKRWKVLSTCARYTKTITFVPRYQILSVFVEVFFIKLFIFLYQWCFTTNIIQKWYTN